MRNSQEKFEHKTYNIYYPPIFLPPKQSTVIPSCRPSTPPRATTGFGWITYLLLLAPTFLLNLLTCVLIAASPILRKHPNSLLVAFLAFEDALLSLFCLVQCAVNLSEVSIAWAASGCQLQAIYVIFFVGNSGYTLCAIAWHNDRRIRGKEGFGIPGGQPSSGKKSFSRLLKFHAVSWTWSALVTFLCTSGVATPGNSEIRVMPSGTYCFIALQELVPSLLFYLPGVCTIGVFLLTRYGQIYYYIYRSWSHTSGQVAPLDGVKSSGEKSVGEEQELTIKISMMIAEEHKRGSTKAACTPTALHPPDAAIHGGGNLTTEAQPGVQGTAAAETSHPQRPPWRRSRRSPFNGGYERHGRCLFSCVSFCCARRPF